MKVLKEEKHDGHAILVMKHYRLFFYLFTLKEKIYMQFLTKNPSLASLVRGKLYAKKELDNIVQAMVGSAKRSIDMLKDPKAKHCPHDVKIVGSNASECAVCSNLIKKDNGTGKGK